MKRVEIIKVTSRNSFPLGENIRLPAIIYYLPLFEYRFEFYTKILLRAIGKRSFYFCLVFPK